MIAAALLLASSAFGGPAPSVPDFSWGSNQAVRKLLAGSETAWNKAISTALRLDANRSKPLTLSELGSLREIVHRADLPDLAFRLLDAGVRKEALIEQATTLYRKAAASSNSALAHDALAEFEGAARRERSLTRLAVGIARAGAARKMAAQGSSSYSFQAMESAIDALKDSAAEATKSGADKNRAESIMRFRASLFEVWDAAQRAKDPNLIQKLDITAAFDQAFGESKSEEKPTETSSIHRNTQQVAAASTPESLNANAPAVPMQQPRAVAL